MTKKRIAEAALVSGAAGTLRRDVRAWMRLGESHTRMLIQSVEVMSLRIGAFWTGRLSRDEAARMVLEKPDAARDALGATLRALVVGHPASTILNEALAPIASTTQGNRDRLRQ
jgi:hypothetical protein